MNVYGGGQFGVCLRVLTLNTKGQRWKGSGRVGGWWASGLGWVGAAWWWGDYVRCTTWRTRVGGWVGGREEEGSVPLARLCWCCNVRDEKIKTVPFSPQGR